MSEYVTELANLDNEMKRLRARLKELRALKIKPRAALYHYMKTHNLQVYQGIRIEKVAPPQPKRLRKTPTQKKTDALLFFRNEGVGDPEKFYQQYLLTQKGDRPPAE